MPAPSNYVTRKVTTYTYTIRFRDGSEEKEVLDHRLQTKDLFSLMSKYPNAFYSPSPEIRTEVYRMPVQKFMELAERVGEEREEDPTQTQLEI